jgi:hypothetical protein
MGGRTIRVLRLVLSDDELASSIQVLGELAGAAWNPRAWGILTRELQRRRNGKSPQTVRMPGEVFDTLPPMIRRPLRQKIVAELRLAA